MASRRESLNSCQTNAVLRVNRKKVPDTFFYFFYG